MAVRHVHKFFKPVPTHNDIGVIISEPVLHRLLTDEEKATAEANGIGKRTLQSRLYNPAHADKWTIEEAITTPPRARRKAYRVENRNWLDLAYKNGISNDRFNARVNSGWDPYVAATKPIRKKRG